MTSPSTKARADRKETARKLLEVFDQEAIRGWALSEPQAVNVLQRLLFDERPVVRWRAVEALGAVSEPAAGGGVERARELVRRALWLMNDESGGVLWQGAEVVGAVLAHVPPLCGEFVPVLASFLEEEPFRAGARWGLWRVACVRPAKVAEQAPVLEPSLGDPDPAIRGHAALALSASGAHGALGGVAADVDAFHLFDFRRGEIVTLTVSEASRGLP